MKGFAKYGASGVERARMSEEGTINGLGGSLALPGALPGVEGDEVPRPVEAGAVIGAPRVLEDDWALASQDAAYARTLARVRAASESRAEFVPLAEQLRALRMELKREKDENRYLKMQLFRPKPPGKKLRKLWLQRAAQKAGSLNRR